MQPYQITTTYKYREQKGKLLTELLTSFEHFGGIEGQVGGAPGLLAAPVYIMSFITGVGFALEARSIFQILIIHTTKTDTIQIDLEENCSEINFRSKISVRRINGN